MTTEDYEKMIRKAFEDIFNRKNFNAADNFFAKDVILNVGKDTIKGLEEAKRIIKERSTAIPDYHCTIDDIIIMGDKAAVRWHSRGKAIKDFAEFKAATPVNYVGITLFERKDNLISKLWRYSTFIDISMRQ